uniref:Uncharacterized protein n=1 Tax=Magallana gigas TaxID=29159 RepID=K1QPN9_MAGGI
MLKSSYKRDTENAEIIRKLRKAALQPISLSTASSNEENFIFGQFRGPSDTEATFDGGELFSFQNNLTREGNTEWEATMNSRFSDYNSWLILKSNSTRESLTLLLIYKSANRLQTTFVENSCEIGIEKTEIGNQTEYKATTRNCGNNNVVRETFKVVLAFSKTEKTENIITRYPGEAVYENHLKYVDTYKVENEDTYYAIFKWPAMEKDGVTLDGLSFELWVNEKNARISSNRLWRFNIV